jgi:5-formyltetrahydrofolate cyclo-ligase
MSGSARVSIVRDKAQLRAAMERRRASLTPAQRRAAAAALAVRGLPLPAIDSAAVVSGFAAMPHELDTGALLYRLHGDGFRLCLPVLQGRDKPLLFRAWAPGDAMDTARWGIQEPKPDKATLEPDVLLVPLLAFDRHGWRLGYGGGYYDRTLRDLRSRRGVTAVGLAYDEQEVDAVPHLDYDQRLDWILTPSGLSRSQD